MSNESRETRRGDSRVWRCEECGAGVEVGYEDLARGGTPICTECDEEMVLLEAPRPEQHLVYEKLRAGLCERGGALLLSPKGAGMLAYLPVADEAWLEVSLQEENYPALYVSLVRRTEAELAEHINRRFGGTGWFVRKMNIDGVEVDSANRVASDDDG
ncbi:MAG: hypothetical protein ACOC8E_08485 [Planctomycetota bacterium]